MELLMSLIKKADVKDYFAKGSGRKVLNFRQSTPDATGYSGSKPSAKPGQSVLRSTQGPSREVAVMPKEASATRSPIVDKATQA
jgi:hypothetical protein